MFNHTHLINILLFGAGFLFLTMGAELLVRGAGRIAQRLGISVTVIGLTVVAFGTSLPELLVSLVANLSEDSTSHIAIGNIVGSNIANLGLILGIAGLMATLKVENKIRRREYPILMAVTFAFSLMALNGSKIGRAHV